ncbi:MAG: hypothetical protein ACTS8Z_06545 [Candidatus Limnocylindrales bacterium]
MRVPDPADDDVRATIDREVSILVSAARLVASGASVRTTVAGLRLTEAAIALARPVAADLDIVLEPVWPTGYDGHSVIVRRWSAADVGA